MSDTPQGAGPEPTRSFEREQGGLVPPGYQAGKSSQHASHRADQPSYGPPFASQRGASQHAAQQYEAQQQGTRPPQHTSRRSGSRLAGWVWPAIAALALAVGLLGGALGGVAAYRLADDTPAGGSSKGLDGVDTVNAAPLEADNGSITKVASELLPSTVQILVAGDEGDATGSGFVLDKQGHIVTNNHVVASAAKGGELTVVNQDGERRESTIVGRSPVYDLAVLKVDDAKDLQPAALGRSRTLRVGESVVAFGSPLGLSSTVTSGIVSALDRPVTTGGGDDSSYINAVQTDAAINPGNSGGPLVNLRGQVVGVNSAIATTGGGLGGESGNIGVGFAIPIEQVRVTVDQILKDGKAYYPVIGAKVETGNKDADGATVRSVMAGSPAAKAGIEDGDVVTKIDDKAVADGESLIVAIRTHQPGDKITLTLERDGKEKDVEVTLGSEQG